jgi:gluconate 2-dehydrogenase gamma chain
MNASDDREELSRRDFLLSSSGLLSSVWLAAQWPAIARAAHHAEEAGEAAAPVGFAFFTPAEAADVDAIASQIVPSGATPGAHEAHAVYFIDKSLGSYFAAMAPDYRKGLSEFQSKFQAGGATGAFAAAPSETQIAYLKTVDRTPFFEMTRMLTILGMFTSPKYGGNYQGSGWKLMGFVDQHAFSPPFGYYDKDYAGFVPYAEKHA